MDTSKNSGMNLAPGKTAKDGGRQGRPPPSKNTSNTQLLVLFEVQYRCEDVTFKVGGVETLMLGSRLQKEGYICWFVEVSLRNDCEITPLEGTPGTWSSAP